MIAIILTAGCGRRMQPLTNDLHKTLIDVGGRTILDRLLDGVIENGIRRVVIVTGYRAEDIRAHVQARGGDLQVEYVHNERWAETNNIVSVALALEQAVIDDDVLLIESDLVLEPGALTALIESPHPDVALVDRFRPGMDGTVLELDGDLVRAVLPPHVQGPNFDIRDKYKTVNIYKLSKRFCTGAFARLITWYASALDAHCYYEVILGILVAGRQESMHAVVIDRWLWCEVDDPVDLDQARFLFDPDRRAEMLDRSKGGLWLHSVLDFCWLRNMHFPTSSAWAELRNSVESVLTSYGSAQGVLDQKMAWWLRCSPAKVIALPGASSAFPILARRFAHTEMVRPEPTFGEYARCFPHARTYRDGPGFDLEALPHRVGEGGIVVIVTPNNPTGTQVPARHIHALAAAHPSRTFLVDTSFAAFEEGESLLALVEEQPLPNVIILESLSKSLGVPGLRLGWLHSGNAALMEDFRREQPVWALGSLAEHFLEMLLKRRAELEVSLVRTRADREDLRARVRGLPGVREVLVGGGNFVLVGVEGGPAEAARRCASMLRDHAVYLKDASAKMDDGHGWLRVAVRTPKDHKALASAWINT